MKIKTSELTDKALDFAVFVANGSSYWNRKTANWDNQLGYTDWILSDGVLTRFRFNESSRAGYWEPVETFHPSYDWSQGGPIIDKEDINFSTAPDGMVLADIRGPGNSLKACQCGHIRLVAAMRCFVASKLGDEVDVPEELL